MAIHTLARNARIVVAAMTVAMAGCAELKLTPQQAQVFDQFNACRGNEPFVVTLNEVQTNGEFTMEGRHSHIELMKRCFVERYGYKPFDPRIHEIIRDPGGV
jgi:hypothetical protein